MTTVVDTNVIAALWDRSDSLNAAAQAALDGAQARGALILPPPVYAELMAVAGRTESFLDSFLRETGINVRWTVEERVWRAAGAAFQAYAAVENGTVSRARGECWWVSSSEHSPPTTGTPCLLWTRDSIAQHFLLCRS